MASHLQALPGSLLCRRRLTTFYTLSVVVLCLPPADARAQPRAPANRAEHNLGFIKARTRIATEDGALVIYDSPRAEGAERGGYLAYWKDLAADEVFVYDRIIVNRSDVVHALLWLRHDFGVDPNDIAPDAFPNETELPAEPTESAESRAWFPATRRNVMMIAGLWEAGEFDLSMPELESARADPPCYPCYAATAGGDVETLSPPTGDAYADAVSEACACCNFPQCPPNCNDGNPCTNDYCQVSCGVAWCAHDSRNCNDGQNCTIDSCNPTTGNCQHSLRICYDGNNCTSDACNPATGNCVYTPHCTAGKCCPAANYAHFCCASDEVCCNDPNFDKHCCPNGQTCCGDGCCDAGTVCCYENPVACCPAAECCNGGCREDCETRCCSWGWCEGECCDGLCCDLGQICCEEQCCGGVCLEESCECMDPPACLIRECTTTPACDDDNPCTDDLCDPGEPSECGDYTCTNPFNTAPCADDGDPCTVDVCNLGMCTNPAGNNGAACTDDGNVCTDDYCQNGICTHPCWPLCSTTCNSGTPGYWCNPCACQQEACSVSLTSATGKPCEAVQLTLIGDCLPCGATSFTLEPQYPSGHEAVQPWLNVGGAGGIDCQGGAQSQTVTVAIHQDAPLGPVPIRVTGTTSSGQTCEGTGTVTVAKLVILGERIDQDDPANATWASLAEGDPLYGGSEASTADNLKLTVQTNGAVSSITWWTVGTGGGSWSPSSSSTATTWELGDILNPTAGNVDFWVRVVYSDGRTQCGKFPVEIGVRTDDVIVVGWIDPNKVPLMPTAVAPWILGIMPPTGPPVTSSFDCNRLVGELSVNDDEPFDQGPLIIPDRDYILNWMFKYANNDDPAGLRPDGTTEVIPGRDFRDETDSHLDESEVIAFKNTKTNYKLFSRLQIKYVNLGLWCKVPPLFVRLPETAIGDTINPCGAYWPAPAIFPGQKGFVDGSAAPWCSSGPMRLSLVNDGSPDAGAIRAFNTLMGKAVPPVWTPLFWENIGSKITFLFNGSPDPIITVQPYPTYYVYRNGRLVDTIPQAPSPKDNFQINPYPFGTVGCIRIGGITPGGRCGDAESPPDTSARSPDYILP